MSDGNPFALGGRVAVVTGAGGGLGVGICTALANAGASVVAVGRTEETIARVAADIAANGGDCLPVVADVSDGASVERMVEAATQRFGGIDIVVNNAAIYPRKSWLDVSEDEWDAVMATNLKGYFLCARAAFPSMKERGQGRVINVASITFFGGWPLLLPYVASKGGIIAFTRALAREIGPDRITVNTISPGAFPTDAEKIHPDPEEYTRNVLEQQSIKRRGTAEDIGQLAVFLASDASSFISGQMIEIDGGWMMH